MSHSFPQQSPAQPSTGPWMQAPPPLSSHPRVSASAMAPVYYVPLRPPLPPPPPRTGVERTALTLTITALPLFYVVTAVNAVSGARPGGMPGLDIVQAVTSALFDPIPYLLLIGLIQLCRRRPTGVPLCLVGVVVPALGPAAHQLLKGTSDSPGPGAAVLAIILDTIVIVTALVTTAASAHGPHPRPIAVTAAVGASVFLVLRSAISLVQAPMIAFLMSLNRHDGGASFKPELGTWLSWHIAREPQHRGGLPFAVGLVALVVIAALSTTSIFTGARPIRGGVFLIGTLGAAATFIASEAGALALGAGISNPGDLRTNGGGNGGIIDYVLVLILVVAMSLAALVPSARRWFARPTGTPADKDSSSMVVP